MLKPSLTGGIAEAFKNDPRRTIAQSLLQTGTSGAPVAATGGYGVAEGLSRIVSALAGTLIEKKLAKKYGERQATANADLAKAFRPPAPTQEAPAPTPVEQAPAFVQNTPQNGATAGVGREVTALPLDVPPAPSASFLGSPIDDPNVKPKSLFGFRVDPITGKRKQHMGVDYPAPQGTPVKSLGGGEVIFAGRKGPNGNLVRVRHGDGTVSSYAHLASIGVKQGQILNGGEPLGAVGSTGRSTGPHLHLSVRDKEGGFIDPNTVLGKGIATPNNSNVSNTPAIEPLPQEAPLAPAPIAPKPISAVQSRRLAIANQLLESGNPDLIELAQQFQDKGLDEQFKSDGDFANRSSEVDKLVFSSQSDRYNASANNREQALEGARTDVRRNNFAVASQGREFSQQDRDREDRQAADVEKLGFDRQTSLMLARENNSADMQQTLATIAGRQATATEKAEAKKTAFLALLPAQKFLKQLARE